MGSSPKSIYTDNIFSVSDLRSQRWTARKRWRLGRTRDGMCPAGQFGERRLGASLDVGNLSHRNSIDSQRLRIFARQSSSSVSCFHRLQELPFRNVGEERSLVCFEKKAQTTAGHGLWPREPIPLLVLDHFDRSTFRSILSVPAS